MFKGLIERLHKPFNCAGKGYKVDRCFLLKPLNNDNPLIIFYIREGQLFTVGKCNGTPELLSWKSRSVLHDDCLNFDSYTHFLSLLQ